MPHAAKIATCCYCGTRAALVLRGRERHELSCSCCGAPLHDLKQMPAAAAPAPARKEPRGAKGPRRAYRAPKRAARGKSPFRKLLGEAVELIEDIFD